MRMLTATMLILSLASSIGCTAVRLRDRLVTQSETLTELQYKQVLGNLARLHLDPYALPFQVMLHDGTAEIQDNGAANITLFRSSMLPPTVTGSRTVVEQWSVHPVSDDTALKVLRVAYQRALGMPVSLTSEHGLANDLAHELKKQIPWPEQLNYLEYTLEQGVSAGIAGLQINPGQTINPMPGSGGVSAPPSGNPPGLPDVSLPPIPNPPQPSRPPVQGPTPPPGAARSPGNPAARTDTRLVRSALQDPQGPSRQPTRLSGNGSFSMTSNEINPSSPLKSRRP